MKALPSDKATEWCVTHGIDQGPNGLPSVRDVKNAVRFSIPSDAGKRTAMVKEQMRVLESSAIILAWIDDFDVWPSGQWKHLFERFRKSYGCEDTLLDKPAHLVPREEYNAAVSIAVYSVLMLWDCYMIGDDGNWIYYSHDEWGLIKD